MKYIGKGCEMFACQARATVDLHRLDHINPFFYGPRSEYAPTQFTAIIHVFFKFSGVFTQHSDVAGIREFNLGVIRYRNVFLN